MQRFNFIARVDLVVVRRALFPTKQFPHATEIASPLSSDFAPLRTKGSQ
jgi:hypothetical protein